VHFLHSGVKLVIVSNFLLTWVVESVVIEVGVAVVVVEVGVAIVIVVAVVIGVAVGAALFLPKVPRSVTMAPSSFERMNP